MATENQHYEQLRRILQEAGFLFSVRDEKCEVTEGSITVANSNLVAKNCEDDQIIATSSDVTVTSGGKSIDIEKVDAENGIIVLGTLSENTEVVSAFYQYSTIELDYLEVVRDDVENLINAKLRSLNSCAQLKTAGVANKLRVITRLWAGGLLLSREYGYNTDSEQTSKDGYRKIQEAKTLLKELCEELLSSCGQDDVNGGSGSVISDSDASLFQAPYTIPENDLDW